jgi:hypothetical protein
LPALVVTFFCPKSGKAEARYPLVVAQHDKPSKFFSKKGPQDDEVDTLIAQPEPLQGNPGQAAGHN